MRENGFYWVNTGDEWTCGQWSGDRWFVLGWIDRPWTDADLVEIDERRITRTP